MPPFALRPWYRCQVSAASAVRSLALRRGVRRSLVGLALGTWAICGLLSMPLRADRFVFQDGGEVQGTQLDLPAAEPSQITIQTTAGIRITVAASRLREVIRSSEARQQYLQRSPKYPDSVEGQWALSEWCREHQLTAEREVHLARILELDPDHVAARHALGYSELGGRWVRQDDYLRQQGYHKYRGQWRLPQEIELARQKEQVTQARQQWLLRLRRWRAQLAGNQPRQVATAIREIREIRDPQAVEPLSQYLQRETARPVKLLYLEALQAIGNAEALETLITASLNDPDPEMFHECLDRIERSQFTQRAVTAYMKALEDKNNVRVNRAAHALGQLGDTQAVPALITALVTEHTVVVSAGGRGAGDTISSTFSPPGRTIGSAPGSFGGTSFSTGGGTRAWQETVNNQQVLDALIRLSGGVNFGFHREAWRAWLAQRENNTNPANLQRR